MTAVWRYFAIDELTHEVRDELPLGEVRITERLKTPGSWSATIPYRHPKATPANLNTETTLIAAVRDDTLIFVFELLDARVEPGSEKLTLIGDGLFGALRRRDLRSTLGMTHATVDPVGGGPRFDGIDQFRIVEDLIDHAQAVPGGNLGITVTYPTLSGVARDRTYKPHDLSIGELIENLADVEDGFDWMIDVTGDVDDFELRLALAYPRRGRATGYRFEADGGRPDQPPDRQTGSANLRAWGLADTSRNRLSRFTALGAGEGRDQLVATAEDPNLIGVLPLREATGSWVDVSNPTTLTGHARRELTIGRRANRLPVLITDPDKEPRLGSYIIGDQVHVTIDDGWIQIDSTYRVIGRNITIDDDGDEHVALELAELSRFT